MELVKITKSKGGKNIINARELHQFLEVKSRFNDWISNHIKNFQFVENKDFATVTKNLVNGGKTKEYAITLNMAKELSMLARNEKGKQARLYFIECESKLMNSNPALPKTFSQALRLAADQAEKIEKQNKEISELKPKAVFADSVKNTDDLISVRQLAHQISQNGVEMGGIKLYDWFRKEGYLSKDNEPKQRYIKQGLFRIIEYTVKSPRRTQLNRTVKITPKGQIYFTDKILK